MIEAARCDGPCALHRLILAATGPDEVRGQWRSQTRRRGEIVDCTPKPRERFEACLIAFTPECADPAAGLMHSGRPARAAAIDRRVLRDR